MNNIDQRILIPISPNVVWDYMSEIHHNPEWQVDCISVQFLTSFQKGQGTRWRMQTEGGREYVVEITAWYDRLGYEYRFIDGAPFKQNLGRLRLQEVPEGTFVQWTFNYEPGGMLAGLRNSLGLKRSLESSMQDSLWTLWKHLSNRSSVDEFEAKSAMREAPDVESRAQYKPRHPSVVEEGAPRPDPAQPVFNRNPVIEEPPIAEDDTRPRVALSESQVRMAPVPEPDFLRDVRDDFDAPTNPNVFASAQSETINPEPVVVEPVGEPFHDAFSPPAENEAPAQAAILDLQETEVVRPQQVEIPEPETERFSPSWNSAPNEPLTVPRDERRDTGQVSIFELFGVPKPSESQESTVVAPQMEEAPIVSTTSAPTPPSMPTVNVNLPSVVYLAGGGRQGHRLIARGRLIKVRRPKS
ncbi:MAG: SRPBCC family protein [bacterium]|nr:SRPBCC family protein [bacterium]